MRAADTLLVPCSSSVHVAAQGCHVFTARLTDKSSRVGSAAHITPDQG
jgi:hypothetical protein